MKLDFVVSGFAKCGTTTICSILDDHPDICISGNKEPNFFSHKYDRGWQWYDKLFKESRGEQLRGEGSTVYSNINFASITCERIARDRPAVRLIFMVRDPIARVEAAFREIHNMGHFLYGIDAPFSLDEAIRKIPDMVRNSLYWRNINVYRQRFSDEQIQIIFLEDFVENPARELKACLDFIGADTSVPIPQVKRQLNAGSTKMYDTRLLRALRRIPTFKKLWNRQGFKKQNELGRRLGLRKRFQGPVRWADGLREEILEQTYEDSCRLLDFCGKDRSLWKLATQPTACGKQVRAAA